VRQVGYLQGPNKFLVWNSGSLHSLQTITKVLKFAKTIKRKYWIDFLSHLTVLPRYWFVVLTAVATVPITVRCVIFLIFSARFTLEKGRRKRKYFYMYNIQSSVLNKLPAGDETCECDAVDFIKFCPDKQCSHGRQCHSTSWLHTWTRNSSTETVISRQRQWKGKVSEGAVQAVQASAVP